MNTQVAKEVLRFRAAERRMLRWLRRLVDWADERLHAAEVRLRTEQEAYNGQGGNPSPVRQPRGHASPEQGRPINEKSVMAQAPGSGLPAECEPLSWERISKANRKAALPGKRKRRMTAAEFDQKYAGYVGVGLAR